MTDDVGIVYEGKHGTHIAGGKKISCKKGSNTKTVVTGKRKRNAEPGVRHQGGRIYDSENGTTCHQCRQKTVEMKAQCKSGTCKMHFCPRCLLNRYNEVVEDVRRKKKWKCPKCRKVCNCSFCRKKQGLQATGILANLARSAGFPCVSQLLKHHPNIKRIRALPENSKNSVVNAENRSIDKKGAIRTSRVASVCQKYDAEQGLPDWKLPKRQKPFPEPVSWYIHQLNGRSKSTITIPSSIDLGKLMCIAEFLSTFGNDKPMPMQQTDIGKVMENLIQPPSRCGIRDSALGDVASFLKECIITWHGEEEDDGMGVRNVSKEESMSWDSWIVAKYPVSCPNKSIDNTRKQTRSGTSTDSERRQSQLTFWGSAPGCRVEMVFKLIHAAVETGEFLNVIEKGIEEVSMLEKMRKKELEKIKAEAKEEYEKHKQEFIAKLINGHHTLTIQEQQTIMDQANKKAKLATSEEIKSRLRWVKNSEAFRSNSVVRRNPLGTDRDGNSYFALSCASLFTGNEKGVMSVSKNDTIALFNDVPALVDAMDVRGHEEGALKAALDFHICKKGKK